MSSSTAAPGTRRSSTRRFGVSAKRRAPPESNPKIAELYSNISVLLATHGTETHDRQMTVEAVEAALESLRLSTPGDHEYSVNQVNAAGALIARSMASDGNLADLDEAARLLREAIATLPPGDPTRKSAEHNLANTAKLGNLLR